MTPRHYSFFQLSRSIAWPLGLCGLVLVLLGLLMWIVPEIAAFLVSGVLFLAGGALLVLAWRVRRLPMPRRGLRKALRPHVIDV